MLGSRLHVEPLIAVRGKPSDEGLIHRYFAAHLWDCEREIFEPVEALLDYIRWMRDQYFVWVADDDKCLSLDSLPIVDSSLWLPQGDRRKQKPASLDGFHGLLNLPPRVLTADDFYTNEQVIECARSLYSGQIDLDPASHAIANRTVRAKRIFTREENGLNKPWAGNIWLNPPFSQWALWVDKFLAEWRSKRINQACILAATRTITAQYFSPLVVTADAVCIFRGRIPFWGGHATLSPNDGHCVFYFGPNRDGFKSAFSPVGITYYSANGE